MTGRKRQIRTADYSQEARERLGSAVAMARIAGGHEYRTDLVNHAKTVGVKLSIRSLGALETGEAGVGQTVLFAVGRLLPNWTEDTPRIILEDGPIPLNDVPVEAATTAPWKPVISDAEIIAMSGFEVGKHYIKLEREYGEEVADDWFVHAAVVRRDARRAARESLAAEGPPAAP